MDYKKKKKQKKTKKREIHLLLSTHFKLFSIIYKYIRNKFILFYYLNDFYYVLCYLQLGNYHFHSC